MALRQQVGSNSAWCDCGKNGKVGFTNKGQGKYWVCANCLKPTIAWLNDCDTCGRKFKGGVPHAPFAFTCPDCE